MNTKEKFTEHAACGTEPEQNRYKSILNAGKVPYMCRITRYNAIQPLSNGQNLKRGRSSVLRTGNKADRRATSKLARIRLRRCKRRKRTAYYIPRR